MIEEPAFVTLLRDLRTLAANRTAIHGMVQNEMDSRIEDFLIAYGFDPPGDTESGYVEADRKVHVHVDHQVQAGSGHNGNFRNRTYAEAKEIYDRESQVLSYHRAYPGQKQGAALMRITTITETLS